jgi:hypothetical protein
MRINLINPRYLTDQHLIAEYREILMATKLLDRYYSRQLPFKDCADLIIKGVSDEK